MTSSTSEMGLLKLSIINLEGYKKIVYREIPLEYCEFLMLCENFQITNFSKVWIDRNGDYNQITDKITYENFLKYSFKKKLIFTEFLMNNNQDESTSEKKTKLQDSAIKRISKDYELKNNDQSNNNENVQPKELNIEMKNDYLSKKIKINNDLMQAIANILSNFTIMLHKVFYVFDDSICSGLKRIVLEVLNNFNESLLNIIKLSENNKNAPKNAFAETDQTNQTDPENVDGETDYAKIRKDFLHHYQKIIDNPLQEGIEQMTTMGFKNDNKLEAVLKKANYNIEKAVEIYAENISDKFSYENSLDFSQLNID